MPKSLSFYFGPGASQTLKAVRVPHSDDEEPSEPSRITSLLHEPCIGKTREKPLDSADLNENCGSFIAVDEENKVNDYAQEDWRMYLNPHATKQKKFKGKHAVQQDGATAA